MTSPRLSWSLVIPTYKRAHILPQCLSLAARQTRPPKDVVVVDASPDWERCRDGVAKDFASHFPGVALKYVRAQVAASTAQRNQGIDLAEGDVLFLIDDDSLMYPDCAEEIMKIYEADTAMEVMGVSAFQADAPPPMPGEGVEQGPSDLVPSDPVQTKVHPKQTLLRRTFKRLLNTQGTEFLPYEGAFPRHEVPASLQGMRVGVLRYMTGSSMTFRRQVFALERFNELLTRYAAGEDQDLSYRASRHGVLINALDAHLCHLEISGGRLSPFHVAVVAGTNPAVLQQLYAPDRGKIHRMWRRILLRRLFINALKDASDRELKFQRTRGVARSLSVLPEIQHRTGDELASWYQDFQADLLSGA